MNSVDRHPQRQLIREAILAGEVLAKLAKQLNPPLHESTLCRYRMALLGKASGNMHGSSDKSIALKGVIHAYPKDEDGVSQYQKIIRRELQETALKAQQRRERWISDAEQSQQIDEETGEVRHNMDHAALSRHDRNMISSLELQAKLAGILTTEAALGNNVQVCVMMPTGALLPGQEPPPEPEGPAFIDIATVRAMR